MNVFTIMLSRGSLSKMYHVFVYKHLLNGYTKTLQIIKYISDNLKIKKGSIHQSNVPIIDRSTHTIIHEEKNNNSSGEQK